jgi:hypothetical protein
LNFYFYPLRKKTVKSSKKINQLKKATKKKNRKGFGITKMLRIVRSFKIKKMIINVDTGDCILNAKLIPIFVFLNHYMGTFSVNYEGKNQIMLQVQNRPIYLIKRIINL